MANFPGSLPSISNPSSTDNLSSPAHATIHGSVNDEVTAVATKIGTGSSTPTDGTVLSGNGTGTSTWSPLTNKFAFYIAGTPSVANDLSWNPTVPVDQTCTNIKAHCKTAPTGADLIVRVYNITQDEVTASITISAGDTEATSTSMTNASIEADDVLRIDCTQQGSTVSAADISVILY